MNAVNVVKEIENAPARTRLVRLEDTRTAEPSGIQLRIHAQRNWGHTHVRSTKLHIYPGRWGEYASDQDQASKGILDVDQIDIPYDPGEVRKEWGTGENDRVLHEDEFLKKKGKYGTHVSDSNGEEEEKDPEIQVEPLSRGSTLVGYPEREEPEQSGRVEGDCEISLCVNPFQFQTGEKNHDGLRTNEMKSAMILSGFTPPSPTIPRRRSSPSMHFVANKSRTANNGTVVKSTRR
jgi:hypothetical protein